MNTPKGFEVLQDEAAELERIEQAEKLYPQREKEVRSLTGQLQKVAAGSLAMDKFNNANKREKLLQQIFVRNRKNINPTDPLIKGGGME